jgi:peptide/nickel transport system ATP-binding protein
MSPLLELKAVSKAFSKNEPAILRGIDLSITSGESLALVGESGCGKTTLGKLITDLHKPTSGQVLYKGKELRAMTKKEYQDYRLKVQMIQQDSFAALNPYKTIFHSLQAAIRKHGFAKDYQDARAKVHNLLADVGLFPTEQFIDKYPHQLSGGQRQRVLIARALSVEPELIVADEPVSMVDVSLRISLLKLLRRMNQKYGISFVYITHDLATARYISDCGKLLVLYLGEVLEIADIRQATNQPNHPYFRALVSAVPKGVATRQHTVPDLPLKGMDIPDIKQLPIGCIFHPRCIYATEKCRIEKPILRLHKEAQVACFHLEEIEAAEYLNSNYPKVT